MRTPIIKYIFCSIIFVALCLMLLLKYQDSTITLNPSMGNAWGFKLAFTIGFVVLGAVELGGKGNDWRRLFSVRGALIFSLISSLVFSVFHFMIGAYFSGLFVLSALLYLYKNRQLYAINTIYIPLFCFATLRIIGVIFSEAPIGAIDKTISFFVLPLSYSFFRLQNATLLRILKLFFRSLGVYMTVSFAFWFCNLYLLGISPIEWIAMGKVELFGSSGFNCVVGWCGYSHPSYISLILLPAMLSGFFLWYNKEVRCFEVSIFVIGVLLIELAMASRIGVIATFFLITLSLLYYTYLKKRRYLKYCLTTAMLLVATIFVVGGEKITEQIKDQRRSIDRRLAMDYISNHFWWGIGTGRQDIALEQGEKKLADTLPKREVILPKTFTHNQYLGDMVQFGIWGLVGLTAILLTLGVYAFRQQDYLLQTFLAFYMLFMTIDEPLYVQEGITRFLVLLTFFVALTHSNRQKI